MSYDPKGIQVIIAGGGPSGAATALSLAARGIRCTVVEASRGHLFKAGETIPPNAVPLLQKLAITHLLDDPQHLRSYGNRSAWGNNTPHEKSFLSTYHPHGWHIDRTHFEQQLKETVANSGVEWLEGIRIVAQEWQNDHWQLTLQDAGGIKNSITCPFIVDATGRASRIARSTGISRVRTDNLSGITTCFTTTGYQLPFYTFIEAQHNGWWYAAPLTRNRIVSTFMTDADLSDPQMSDIGYYLVKLKETKIIGGMLNDIVITDNTAPVWQPASTTYLPHRYGPSWLAVGDAAFSYDPLSSYGIISALESGYYAGHAIAEHLAGDSDALTAYDWILCNAFTAYKEMYTHQYLLETRWPHETFWKRRHSTAIM